MWHRRYILLSVVMVRDMNLPIPYYICILWQDKKHRISDVGCSLLQIWLNPNQTALKGFHQIASLRTHKQPCLGIRKPWSKFWVWGEILLARILLLLSILNVAIFCVDSSLSQDWKVGEHLCWNFPIFSQVIVVFGVQCWRLIHPDDVPQNWQQEGAEEKQKLLVKFLHHSWMIHLPVRLQFHPSTIGFVPCLHSAFVTSSCCITFVKCKVALKLFNLEQNN